MDRSSSAAVCILAAVTCCILLPRLCYGPEQLPLPSLFPSSILPPLPSSPPIPCVRVPPSSTRASAFPRLLPFPSPLLRAISRSSAMTPPFSHVASLFLAAPSAAPEERAAYVRLRLTHACAHVRECVCVRACVRARACQGRHRPCERGACARARHVPLRALTCAHVSGRGPGVMSFLRFSVTSTLTRLLSVADTLDFRSAPSLSLSPSLRPSLPASLRPSVPPSLRPSLRPSLPPSVPPSVRPSVRPTLPPSLVPDFPLLNVISRPHVHRPG
jgi:hypothetical protein